MKLPKISALFGAAISSWFQSGTEGKGLTDEQAASLEASEKKLGEMEADLAKAKSENEAHTKKIGELEKSVTDLNGQVTTLTEEKKKLTEEKAELQKKLDAKPTGQATTVIPGKSEEKQAADQNAEGSKAKSFRTAADDEADAVVNALYPDTKK